MPLVILACRVLESLMEPYRREAGISALFMEYGLHRTPELMAAALQGAIDRLTEPSVVILGYGLCGNGVVGLQARQHTLIVPRADDCITLLLGSYERYMQEFSAEPGTYYLTKGWLESGSHPLSEYQQLLEKYDQATADWILDEQYRNYRRLVLIASSQAELVACRAQALEIAEFCAARWGFRYEERIGSTDLVKRLVTKAHELRESTDDFLLIPPGGEIKQEMSWRAPGERPAASSGPKHPNLQLKPRALRASSEEAVMRVNYQANVTPRLRMLSNDQIEQIVYAAMDVLQRIGTRVQEANALKLLRDAGCVIKDGNLVHIPAWLVETSLQSAPSRIVLAGRDREKRIALEKDQIYFGTGSDCPFILDPYNGERRRCTYEDVYRAAKISDALPHIEFHMSVGLTSDVPIGTYDRHQLLAMVRGTTKPLVITAVDRGGLADQLEMACAALGGVDEWRKAPLFAVYIEPNSPLENSGLAVEKLLYAAENDIPAIYTPCPMCGATAPATMAGTLVQGLAECLTGVVISQLKRKGAAVIIGGVMSVMDMSTTICSYGAPELTLLSAAMTNIAQYLHLPMFSTAGCSDAKIVDQQAAIEGALSIAFAALSGANLIHDVGYLESGLSGSYDMLVMSNEVIGMVKRTLRGVAVDAEHLALDVTERVGPGGHYLMDDHTMKHFRTEFWFPELLDRSNWPTWQANGAKSLGARVHEKVLDLIEHYEPAPTSAEIDQELVRIVARADETHRSEEKVKLV